MHGFSFCVAEAQIRNSQAAFRGSRHRRLLHQQNRTVAKYRHLIADGGQAARQMGSVDRVGTHHNQINSMVFCIADNLDRTRAKTNPLIHFDACLRETLCAGIQFGQGTLLQAIIEFFELIFRLGTVVMNRLHDMQQRNTGRFAHCHFKRDLQRCVIFGREVERHQQMLKARYHEWLPSSTAKVPGRMEFATIPELPGIWVQQMSYARNFAVPTAATPCMRFKSMPNKTTPNGGSSTAVQHPITWRAMWKLFCIQYCRVLNTVLPESESGLWMSPNLPVFCHPQSAGCENYWSTTPEQHHEPCCLFAW